MLTHVSSNEDSISISLVVVQHLDYLDSRLHFIDYR